MTDPNTTPTRRTYPLGEILHLGAVRAMAHPLEQTWLAVTSLGRPTDETLAPLGYEARRHQITDRGAFVTRDDEAAGEIAFVATPLMLRLLVGDKRSAYRLDAVVEEDDGSYKSPTPTLGAIVTLQRLDLQDEVWRIHVAEAPDEYGLVYVPVFAVNAATGEMVDLDPHHPEDMIAFAGRFRCPDDTVMESDFLLLAVIGCAIDGERIHRDRNHFRYYEEQTRFGAESREYEERELRDAQAREAAAEGEE